VNDAFPHGFTPFPEIGAISWDWDWSARPPQKMSYPKMHHIIRRVLGAVWWEDGGPYLVTQAQLVGRQRHQFIVRARHAVYLLAHTLTRHSSVEIGLYFGDRDHSTILVGIKRAKERMAREPAFRATVEAIAEDMG